MARLIALALLFLAVLSGCNPPRIEVQTLQVAPSHTTDCPPVGYIGPRPERCLQVRKSPSQPWYGFPDTIRGFVYQEGFLYELELQVAYDTSGMMDVPPTHTLLRVLSKTPN